MTAPRRWFQFSLLTMLVGVTLFGMWFGWQVHVISQRKAVRTFAEQRGVEFRADAAFGGPLWAIRRVLGDERIPEIVYPSECWSAPVLSKEEKGEIEKLFPEAVVMVYL